jgi:hypothetical protein
MEESGLLMAINSKLELQPDMQLNSEIEEIKKVSPR